MPGLREKNINGRDNRGRYGSTVITMIVCCLLAMVLLKSAAYGGDKAEVFAQLGHSSLVNSVAITPDGKYALSGSSDNTLILWDIATGKEIRTFSGHSNRVSSVAISPDGKYALSGSDDKTLKLWDISTGMEIRTFTGHSKYVNSVAISPDGKYALSGSRDKTLKLWDIATGKKIRTFTGHSDWVNSVAISPDGKYALSGSRDKTLKLWDIATGRKIRTYTGHTGWINSVAITPDRKYVLSGCNDNILKLWDIATGRVIRTFKGLSFIAIASVAITNDGKYAAVASPGTLILLDIATGRVNLTFEVDSDQVNSVAITPDGKYVLTGNDTILDDNDKSLKLWDITTGSVIRTIGDTNRITSIAITPNDKYALSVVDGTLKLLDIATGSVIRTFDPESSDTVLSVAISPNGKYALSGGKSDLTLWDIDTGSDIQTFDSHEGWHIAVSITPDGKYALSGNTDNTLKLWDIATSTKIRTFTGHSSRICSVSITPDGKYVISGSEGDTLKLWDVTTGSVIRTFSGHSNYITSFAITPDGKYALFGNADGTSRLRDIATGKELVQFVSFNDGEWVAITPEGYYNTSENGAKHLNVRVGNNVYGIDNFARQFYRPEIVQLALSGKAVPIAETIGDIASAKRAPTVKIVSPANNLTTSSENVEIKLGITDEGGGVGDVNLFVNGSLVTSETRRVVPNVNIKTLTFPISLKEGKNEVRALAYNKDNSMASNADVVTITSDYKADAPTLHVLVVGIDNFENESLKLKYAVSDAKLFADTIKEGATALFKHVNIEALLTKPGETTKQAITDAFKRVAAKAKGGDYFIFYGASHGYIATFNDGKPMYFLITANVLYLDPDNLAKSAISLDELIGLIGSVQAQNKITILDTCQSEEAGKAIQIAMAGKQIIYARTMSNATAMQLLKMASGSSVFTASQSIQEAIEGYNGHGLFTYTLVEGLQGQADANWDKFIMLNELKSYVEPAVVTRSIEKFNRQQVPYINIGTTDFAIVKVKQRQTQ
ncbi:MAG: caspase family protein [Nitrospirae bacterium]|nr:caspase family protein [Nitrospirota bacterium]